MNTENPTPAPAASPSPAARVPQYEIRVAGRLASRWSAWFDGLVVTNEADGTSLITGPVVDQSALHGLIQKLRDVGIPLLSLTQLPPEITPEPAAHPTQGERQ